VCNITEIIHYSGDSVLVGLVSSFIDIMIFKYIKFIFKYIKFSLKGLDLKVESKEFFTFWQVQLLLGNTQKSSNVMLRGCDPHTF
jgi:hypothetical protein